ncbi:MAG TPA: hypothetical protein V6D08_04350 [Candidatus Obscuribacterales bacterium]
MKQITIRGVSDDLARALKEETRRRGTSLNQAVLDLLRQSLGLEHGRRYDNGLSKFAGTWSRDELADFERATEICERIDEEFWK